MGNLTGNRIRFIGLNSLRWPSNTMIESFRPLVNFSVYQSTSDNDLWSKIGGVQDDIFVYDRCGLLAYYVPFPHSDVSRRYVEAAIVSAHYDSPCQCLPTPSSASSNCTNGTGDSPVVEVSSSRQVQTPVPSVQSQRQVRTPHHHRSSRLSATTALPPECSRISIRDICSNNTTHHLRSLTPLQLRCCHRHHHHHHHHLHQRTQRRPPPSKCLCLAVGGGERGCLCRPGDGVMAGSSCFCRLHESTVESGCNCEETKYPDNDGQQCSCTLPREQVARQCARQGSPRPYGRYGGADRPGQSGALCSGHVQPLL